MQRRNYLPLVAGLAVILVTVVINSAVMAQVSGAVFTTNCIDVSPPTGQCQSTFVNGNVYDFIEDVFINGGPRPNTHCDAAGLPDGIYYFQVTDPSGSELLSTDDITNRRVTVSGGVIVDHSGTHFTGIGKCAGSKAVQLTGYHPDGITPFIKPTPNPGGEYKVWMTPVDWYDTTKGFHGFIPSKSKTDNFKVAPPDDGGPIYG